MEVVVIIPSPQPPTLAWRLWLSLYSFTTLAGETGELQGVTPKKRGRPKKNPLEFKVAKLEHQKRRLEEELRKARLIIDVQKKVAEMLGDSIPEMDESSE
jgi:hypothetical protein